MDIRRIQDINLSDIELRSRYYGLFNGGQINEARQMVNDYPQLRGKVLNAETLNQFVGSILELEQNYYSEVEDFLYEQRQDLQLSIDELVFMNDYDNNVQYEVNNFVIYGDNLYYCYVIPPIGTLPTNSDYWIELNLKGEQGAFSLGVQLVGTWDITKPYNEKEMVIYNNKLYVARSSSIGVVPTDNTYWILAIDNKPQTIYVGATEPEFVQVGSMWIKVLNPTYEGSFVNFKSDEGVNLSMEIQGKSVQNGVPTPEAKVDIVSVGDNGSVVVKVTGKNLLPSGAVKTLTNSGITAIVNADGTIISNGTSTWGDINNWILGNYRVNPTVANTIVTLYPGNTYYVKDVELFTYENGVDGRIYPGKITILASQYPNGFRVTGVRHVTVAVGTILTNKVYYPQLELGSTSSSYEPYKEQLVTIPLTQPLRSVGSVYDRGCVKVNGLWGNERNVGYTVFDGSTDEAWFHVPAYSYDRYNCYSIPVSSKKYGALTVISNRLKFVSEVYSKQDEGITGSSYSSNVVIKALVTKFPTVDALKTWLATNPLIVQYQLATPVFEPFTQAIQDQLNKLQTYQGVTNVFTTDPLQPNMIVTYNNK